MIVIVYHRSGSIHSFLLDRTIDILISELDEIRRLRQNSLENASHYGVLVEDQHDLSFISIDTDNRMFYWIDEADHSIYRAHLTPSYISTTYPQKISDDPEHTIHPTSIAVDWIGQNLYVTDTDHNCIWLMKNDGRYATQLIKDIESPWVVAVNPILGIIYFINYEHEYSTQRGDERIVAIESAWMNGENRTILINTDIIYPTDLVIDFYQNHRVYWTDEKKESIESMNYDGTDRITIAHIGIHAPHSLDIFGTHLFWINRNNRSLYMIEKFGRGISTMVLDRLESPLFVRIYHPLKQIQGGLTSISRSSRRWINQICLLHSSNESMCLCQLLTFVCP